MSEYQFKEGIDVKIQQESRRFTTVRITGAFELDDIKKSASVYVDLYNKGVRRLLIDLSAATAELDKLLSSHEDLNKGLGAFDKIVVLVKDSENAFKVKAAALRNPKIKVYYDKTEAIKWLEE